jgi:hypothetical protein
MRIWLCLLAIALQPAYASEELQEPTPAWAEPYAAADFPASELRYAGYTQQMRYAAGSVQAYAEIWIRATSASALDAAAQIEIAFDASYQRAVVHRVDVLRGGRLESRLARTKMEVVGRESDLDALMFTGRKSLLLVVDDVRIGDIVRYAYSVHGRNPVYEDRIFDEFPLAWDEPVQHVRYRVLHDAHRSLQYRAIGNDAPDVSPRRFTVDGLAVLAWDFAEVAGRPRRAGAPAWFVQHPFLQVSEYRSWGEVADWAARLFAQEANGDALSAHVHDWLPTADLRDIVDFVQTDIRYYGIEIGQNSHRPHAPEVTIERRFGDCKDKSVLLSTLLERRGIHAHALLVSMRYGRAIADMLPSPSAFDHAIVELQLDGRRVWIDPTRSSQAGPLTRRAVGEFGVGLPVTEETAELTELDTHAQSFTAVQSTERFALALDDHETVLSVETRYRGAVAELYRGADTPSMRAMLEQQYLGYYARFFPDAEPNRPIDIAADDEDMLVSESYRLGRAWHGGAARLAVFAGTVRDYAALPDGTSASRDVPLALTYPLEVTYEAQVDYPEGVGFATEPAQVTIEDDYIVYGRSIEPVPGRVVVRHVYRTKLDHVPADAVREHVARRRQLLDALDLELTFLHPTEQRVMDRHSRLRRLLETP